MKNNKTTQAMTKLLEHIASEEKVGAKYENAHDKVINRIEQMLRSMDEQTLEIAEKQIEVLFKLKA